MSLKINSRFSIERDARNWKLVEVVTASSERVSYFGSLDLLAKHCIDRSLDPEGGFEMMQVQLVNVHADLKKAIRKQGLSAKRTIMEAMKNE